MSKVISVKIRIKYIILLFLVWGSIIAFLSVNRYFVGFYGDFHLTFTNLILEKKFLYSTQGVLFELLSICSIIILLVPIQIDLKSTRVYQIVTGLYKIIKHIGKGDLTKSFSLEKEEKLSLLVLCVKFTFLPLLVNFMYHNIKNLLHHLSKFSGDWLSILSPEIFCLFTFKVLFYLILSIDTVYFVFGYLVESKKLKSTIKSVEPTLFGWIVALACYPPYNELSSWFLGWHSNDFATSSNTTLNYILSILSILMFTIYVMATINLGAKASNMTNRGIVSKGAYSIVRHPDYISKNIAWWLMGIPFIANYGYIAVLSLIAWSFIYYLRAITEEKHLSLDREYIEYKKKVPYKFIPGIYK
ncbi:methyltransferase family protein [Pseudofulvibacter geojedonensis]|uniref:Methyltransferase family protein n=1 Tax=Pseudofulvibacter geojedonensis TaxID=1123758 RepID=A0ABW3HXX7_9FLAO